MKKIFQTFLIFGMSMSVVFGQTTYTSRAAFDGAVTGTAETLHFDDLTDGDLVATGGALTVGPTACEATFTFTMPNVSLRVRDAFTTTSPSNYMGTNYTEGEETLIESDAFTMTFSRPVVGIGMYIITSDNTTVMNDDWTLTLNTSGTATSVATVDPNATVAGANVYFLGIRDVAGFTAVTFSAANAFGLRFDVEDIVVEIAEFPEIAITDASGNDIVDGSNLAAAGTVNSTDFGNNCVNGGTTSFTYTITNSGNVDLDFTGTPVIEISGTNAGDFSVSSQIATNPLPHTTGNTTTFAIEFDPSATGERSAIISIANTDCDENPYDFVVKGDGIFSTITIVATTSSTSEASSGQVYRFTRTDCLTGSLPVNFSIEGTAQDSDYAVSGATSYSQATNTGVVTFGDGVSTVDLTVSPIDDSMIEADETVIVKIGNP